MQRHVDDVCRRVDLNIVIVNFFDISLFLKLLCLSIFSHIFSPFVINEDPKIFKGINSFDKLSILRLEIVFVYYDTRETYQYSS